MLRKLMKRFRRNQRGVAAVEFALIAPLFALLGVCTADIGFAVAAKIDMDQSLRGAAQVAMANLHDDTQLQTALQQSFGGQTPVPTVTAASQCECSSGGGATSCYAPCGGGNAPLVFVDMTMTKAYNAIILPDMTLTSKITIRLR